MGGGWGGRVKQVMEIKECTCPIRSHRMYGVVQSPYYIYEITTTL